MKGCQEVPAVLSSQAVYSQDEGREVVEVDEVVEVALRRYGRGGGKACG